MGKAHDRSSGSALIYAEKGALFIEKQIDSYNNYDPSKLGDNSVLMAEKLARKFPDLIHVFEHHCAFYPHGLVLYNQNYKWSHSYGLHIYKTGHIPELQKINFETVRNINNTIGAVFRYILFGSKELCSSQCKTDLKLVKLVKVKCKIHVCLDFFCEVLYQDFVIMGFILFRLLLY